MSNVNCVGGWRAHEMCVQRPATGVAAKRTSGFDHANVSWSGQQAVDRIGAAGAGAIPPADGLHRGSFHESLAEDRAPSIYSAQGVRHAGVEFAALVPAHGRGAPRCDDFGVVGREVAVVVLTLALAWQP